MKSKKKLTAFFSMLMVVAMLFSTSISAFAETTSVKEDLVSNSSTTVEYIINANNGEAVTYANIMATGTVNPYTSIYLYPTLDNYIGFNRDFYVSTSQVNDGIIAGFLVMTLSNSKGEVIDSWTMGPNDDVTKTYFLPSSGSYTLKVTSWVSMPVYITTAWAA